MGHSTADIRITATDELLRSPERALDMAVREWYDTEAGRYDDARPGVVKVIPLEPASAQLHNKYDAHDRGVGQSWVVPVTSDVRVKTHKVTLPATAETARVLAEDVVGQYEASELLSEQFPDTWHRVVGIKVTKRPKLLKPKAVKTEGQLRTEYRVCHGDWRVLSKHKTLAQASAAAIEHMEAQSTLQALHVEAVVLRGNDASLLSVARPIRENASYQVEVSIAEPARGAVAEEFVCLFDYHH